MDIIVLIKVLLRKWWIIVGVPIICTVIAYFFARELKDVYKSTAQVSTGFTLDDKVRLDNESYSSRDLEVKFNNLIQNIKSNTVLHLLAYRLMLHDLENSKPFSTPDDDNFRLDQKAKYYSINEFQVKLDSFEVISKYNDNDLFLDEILSQYKYDIESIKENLRIWRIDATDYISIEYFSENPYLSAFAVNALCDEFIRYNRKMKLHQSVESISFFNQLLNEKKIALDAARQRLNYVKSTNQIIDFEIEGQAKVNQLENLEQAKTEEERKINALNLSLTDVNARIRGLTSTSSNDANSKNLGILTLREKIKKLNEQYINGGMKDNTLLDSINVLRDKMTEISSQQPVKGRHNESLLIDLQNKKFEYETELKIARSSLETINQNILNLKSNVSNFASKGSQMSELENEVTLIEKEYLNVQEKLNDAQNLALISGNTITQVLKGQPSEEPESSKKILIVIFAMLGSFMLCVTTIIVFELLDLSIKNTEKFKQLVKLPLVGTLNNLPSINNNDVSSIFQDTKKSSNHYEFFRQSLRKLRFEIEKQNKKVILLSSTEKKEGKTFLLLSLANSLSLIQKKVLIIDTNFKNNTITSVFFRKDGPGRKPENVKNPNMFMLNASASQAAMPPFDKFIIRTDNELIDVIGNKPGFNSPSEIFAGKRFDVFLKEYSKVYDYIFLEGSSLNNFSDTKELIDYCDGIIGVFSADKVLNQLDKESIEYFRNLNSKYIGSVLNKVSMKNVS